MKILVIVVTYNGLKWINKCFDSVKHSNIAADLFIVDNGSSDGTIEIVRNNYKNAIFIESKKNLGFGKANNIGLQYALENQYDYAYLLNQDAWIFPDTLEKLIEQSVQTPMYGILSPFQLRADALHLEPIFCGGVCSRDSNEELFDDVYFERLKPVYTVPEVQAAHWLISRECLLKVGLFSPTFPHYGEDNNYQNRVYYHGFKVGIVPRAKAVHDSVPQTAYSRQKAMRLAAYIKQLVKMSNIHCAHNQNLFYVIIYEFYYCLKFKSLMPLYFLAKIIANIVSINRNKAITKNKSAFLEVNNIEKY